MAAKGEKHSPLEQFEIIPFTKTEIGGYDISFTNSSLSMIITVAVITLFLTLTVNPRSLVPTRMQLISELMYNFVAQLLNDTVGDNGKKYFPFVFSLFMFVLIGNMVGMVPHQATKCPGSCCEPGPSLIAKWAPVSSGHKQTQKPLLPQFDRVY